MSKRLNIEQYQLINVKLIWFQIDGFDCDSQKISNAKIDGSLYKNV